MPWHWPGTTQAIMAFGNGPAGKINLSHSLGAPSRAGQVGTGASPAPERGAPTSGLAIIGGTPN